MKHCSSTILEIPVSIGERENSTFAVGIAGSDSNGSLVKS